jgi:endonuclease/exonuclease/phosphatase family metal-dependent hydrolase
MKNPVARCLLLWSLLLISFVAEAQTNTTIRIMAANLNGNIQNYQPFALRIFEGLKPDIVAIQEFNYQGNTPSDFRSMLDTAFGTDFVYFRENYTAGGSIPNGIISRYPILDSGSWVDTVQSSPNRGFAWAHIDIPGSNDVYVVSVHLLSSAGATARAQEATNLKALIQANFPANAWVVVAGDFNTSSRSEACVTTFKTFLSDSPIPTDSQIGGDADTNEPRNKPYDYVLPSFNLASNLTNVIFSTLNFPNGLVFDSRVFTSPSDLANFSPVLLDDSGNAQHMGVLKDFSIAASGGNGATPPTITSQPQSQTVDVGTNVAFTVVASSTNALSYQWHFNNLSIPAATNDSFTITNVQGTNAGTYTVVVANSGGSVVSSNAVLTVNTPPLITGQPSSNTVFAGQSATFTVVATGAAPLSYQWRFNGTDVPSATGNSYTRTNVQTGDQGNYLVVITNYLGSVTSATAGLTVTTQAVGVIAQWNFNSPTPDGNTATGTLTPSTGSGVASYAGGVVANGSGFLAGSSTDPNTGDNSAWGTTNYPASSAANKTAGIQFSVSTAGKQNIVIRWDQRSSNTGSKYYRLQYSTNGTTFADFPTAITLSSTSFESETNDLSGLPGVNDNPNFAFRIVAEFQSTATGSGSTNYIGAGGTYAPGGSVRFDMVTMSGTLIPVIVAPNITNQPSSQAIVAGSNATFTVGADGTAPSYQWQLWSTNIPGATGITYTRFNVQPADEGPYSVVVSNSAGFAASSNAFLTVIVAPAIIDQPVDQTVVAGTGTSFGVNASGSTPLNYQWQREGNDLSGETNSTLDLNNIDLSQAGAYSVIISNAAGLVVSSNATLSVYTSAAATLAHPQWSNGLFQLNVDGVPGFPYAVQVSTNLLDWLNVQTNTSPFLFMDPDSDIAPQRFYRAVYFP